MGGPKIVKFQENHEKLKSLTPYWLDFVKEREAKLKNPKINPITFLDTENPESKEVFETLKNNIQKFDNKALTGKEYGEAFKEKLLFFQKKAYFLNKVLFKMMPVKMDSH